MSARRRNDLLLEGREIKARLHVDHQRYGAHIHVDWLRFTVNRRFAPVPSVELLFPKADNGIDYQAVRDGWSETERMNAHSVVLGRRQRIVRLLRDLPDPDYAASSQAFTLAEDVATILGPEFRVDTLIQGGKDFYRFRIDILRNDHPVGWVGFLSTSTSIRGQAQANTLHCNLEGMACTFAQSGWLDSMANYIELHRGLLTRVDLAADFFDGMDHKGHEDAFARFAHEYRSGLMDHLGHRPQENMAGSWLSKKKGRSFYLGSRESGKLTNLYEKGKQLFGKEDESKWLRVELRYGNQKRLLPAEILRRPASAFAGASEWHASIVRELELQAVPMPVKCEPCLPTQTVEAEVTRNARWFMNTAGASAVLAFMNLPKNLMHSLFDEFEHKLPKRLSKFTRAEVASCYEKVFTKLASSGRASPAFA
ncbi:replication initiation factor domain-containing protein [Comamonas sp. GB3 AK4-5]|uniref:replication initiation factor domain-containing protein n=1 Tax=Comamonas sp. GB3 AK4-5 TaxID=3231487 RepID=UPI00351E3790